MAEINQEKVQQFVGRLVEDIATACRGAMTYIGDRNGIFRTMAASGPVTVEELAEHSGLNARYLREWLGAMATADYITYDPATRKYTLPLEHALPLSDENFPFFVGGFVQSMQSIMSVAPKVAEHFRTGKGVPQSEYPPETWEAMERGSLPMFKHHLVQSFIPAMPDVQRKLESGAAVADIGCGGGWAAITLAQAFPKSRIHGFDQHAGSIERARANARAAGAEVSFETRDCCALPPKTFDLITVCDVVHDAVDPVALLQSIRSSLADGGSCMMLEMNVSADVEHNMNPLGRLLYPVSTLYCLTTSMAHGGAGIGACMGEPKARELAAAAGFSFFERLPIENPMAVIYRLKA